MTSLDTAIHPFIIRERGPDNGYNLLDCSTGECRRRSDAENIFWRLPAACG